MGIVHSAYLVVLDYGKLQPDTLNYRGVTTQGSGVRIDTWGQSSEDEASILPVRPEFTKKTG